MVQLKTETDVERLRQAALLLEAENRRLAARVVELTRQLLTARGEAAEVLQQRLAEVERQLTQTRRELYGPSSEKRPGAAPAAGRTEDKPQQSRAVIARLHEWAMSVRALPQSALAKALGASRPGPDALPARKGGTLAIQARPHEGAAKYPSACLPIAYHPRHAARASRLSGVGDLKHPLILRAGGQALRDSFDATGREIQALLVG
jgi:hypothetical protein